MKETIMDSFMSKLNVYYYIHFCPNAAQYIVEPTINVGSSIDSNFFNSGNYYLTEDEAQQEADFLNLRLQIKKWQRENDGSFKPDWSNSDQRKYVLYYDHRISEFGIDFYRELNGAPFYFSSKEKILEMIEEIGEEKIKRVMFG